MANDPAMMKSALGMHRFLSCNFYSSCFFCRLSPIWILSVLLILNLGCFGNSENQDSNSNAKANQPSEPSKSKSLLEDGVISANPDADARRSQKSRRPQDSEAPKDRPDFDIAIDEVLKRDDLSPQIRRRFLDVQRLGVDRVPIAYVDKLTGNTRGSSKAKSKAPPGFVVIESTHKTKSPLFGQLPTLATNPIDHSKPDYSYDRKRDVESIENWIRFLRPGIDHFLSLELSGVSREQKKTAADLIQQINHAAIDRFSESDWSSLLEQHQTMAEASPSLMRDPLFQMSKALLLFRAGKNAEAKPLMDDAFQQFSFGRYPARVPVCFNFFAMSNAASGPEEHLHRMARFSASLTYWFQHDFRASPDEYHLALKIADRFIVLTLAHSDFRMLDQWDGRVVTYTQMPKWLRMMIRGEVQFQQAWKLRGTEVASKISKVEKRKFLASMERATQFFQAAYETNPGHPLSAQRVMMIACGARTDIDPEAWFEKAIQACPDGLAAYSARLYFLRPEWEGNIDDMIRFSLKYSDATDPSAERQLLILDCFSALTAYSDRQEFKKRPAPANDSRVLKRCLEVVDRFIDLAPVLYQGRNRSESYFQTAKAILATRTGDSMAADNAYHKLGGKLDPDAVFFFANSSTSFDAFRAKNFALTREYGEEAAKLEALMRLPYNERIEKGREIILLCDDNLKENTNSAGRLYFEQSREKTKLERVFANGGQVKLQVDSSFLLWTFSDFRQTKYVDEQSLHINNEKLGRNVLATCIAEFPGAKVIECDIQQPLSKLTLNRKKEGQIPGRDFAPMIQTHKLSNPSRAFGVGFAHASHEEYSPEDTDKKFQLGRVWMGKWYAEIGLNRGVHKLRLVVDSGYIEIYLDGEFITRRTDVFDEKEGVDPFFRITQRETAGRGSVTFSNIRLRKMESARPPFEQTADTLIAHFKRVAQEDTDDPWSVFWLGQAYQMANQYNDAIQCYLEASELGMTDPTLLAFWYGEALDRLGRHEEALAQYEIACDSKLANDISFQRNLDLPQTNHQNWAAFRVRWHRSIRQGTTFEQKGKVFSRLGYFPESNKTLSGLLTANEEAARGNIDRAGAIGKEAMTDCPTEVEEVVIGIVKGFRKQKIFRELNDVSPLYLAFPKPIPFVVTRDQQLQ